MSDSNRWWALDLVLVVLLADVAGVAIYLGAPAPIRLPLALLLVLVLPGYALTAVLFPARNPSRVELASLDDKDGGLLNPLPGDYQIAGAERVALSVTSSVAIVPAVAALVSLTPAGIALEPVLGGVLTVTVGLAIVAVVRRLWLPPDQRYAVPFSQFVTVPRPFAPPSRLSGNARRVGRYNLAAVVGLVLLVSSVGFALAVPPQPDGFTEFYVVTDDATGDSPYPTTFQVGQATSVTLGITNHEHRDVTYTVVIGLQEPGGTDTDPSSSVLGQTQTTVADGETRALEVDVQPTSAGERRLVFLLYRGSPPASPSTESAYRVLDLAVTVEDGARPSIGGPAH